MLLLQPESLIGKRYGDPELARFLSSIREKPEAGRFAEMDTLDYQRSGLTLYFDQRRRLISMFLHGPGHEDRDMYPGSLPYNLSFESDRNEVRQKLGPPSFSGEEEATGNPWERFDFSQHSIHVKYCFDLSGIEMITVMAPEIARGEI